jgi:hypothetical protein
VSLLAHALDELERLCGVLGFDAAGCRETFADLAAPSAWCRLDAPTLASGISHGVPYGFSVALGRGEPELRALLEAQSLDGSAAAYFEVGRAMTRWIGGRVAVGDVTTIEPLFVPDERAPFRVWHGVVWRRGSTPTFKIYFSARARGTASAKRRVAAAMGRLGHRGVIAGEPTIVGLDVGKRLKVYSLVHEAELARLWQDEGAERFVRAFSGGDIHWLVCFAFSEGKRTIALHHSLARHLPDDAEAARRIEGLAEAYGLDAQPYHAGREVLGGRHHFVSFQHDEGAPRLTIYFTPAVSAPPRARRLPSR